MADPSSKSKILFQFDADAHPSSFDRVVAVDAGVEHVFSYGQVTAESAVGLTHGAMFTRGPKDLHRTAIFVGGSDVAAGEAIVKAVTGAFFGPMRVSVMMDANGCNTTAAAAVLAAARCVDLAGAQAVVLAGTGPVGQRAARLLAGQGASVRLASRSLDRASQAADAVNNALDGNPDAPDVTPCATADEAGLTAALDGASVLISAGAAGVRLVSTEQRRAAGALKVAIDLNAVPPAGLEGVEITDAGRDDQGCALWGAIGVGGFKMKIHRAAVASLFEANDRLLDAEAIYRLGESLNAG